MELQDILKRRKMVRAFEQHPVPRATLDRVLASVLHAPSAGYTQGNAFLVLDEPEAATAFWDVIENPQDPTTPEQKALRAPAVVLPLANRQAYLERYSQPDKAGAGLERAERWPVPYWDIDAGMAAMLILLAAIEEGLGAWFFGFTTGEGELLARFHVPPEYKPIGAVALGYAAAHDPLSATASPSRIARRSLETLLHRNGW